MSKTGTAEKPTVMVVEDDFLIAEDLRATCEELGASVLDVISEATHAAERILERAPDFVLMDVRLGGVRDGVNVAMDVHSGNPAIKLIFVTGSNEPPTIERIKSDHPYRILIKPISPAELKKALKV